MMKLLRVFLLWCVVVSVGACSNLPESVSERGVTIAARGESLEHPEPLAVALDDTATSEPTETIPSPAPSATAAVTVTLAISPTATPTIEITAPAPEETAEEPGMCLPRTNAGMERALLDLINEEREAAGSPALIEQAQLTEAARNHSVAMGCENFFDHVDPDAGGVDARVTETGYSFAAVGENIAAGYESAAAVFEAWMKSAGHEENLLNPVFSQVGIGSVMIEGSQYETYWTLILAAPD